MKNIRKNIGLDYITTALSCLNFQSSIWVLYLSYCGMNLAQIGIIEGLFHATSMICEVPSGAVADLLGRKKSMILSKVCFTVSCLIMLFTKNFWLFSLSFAIQALGYNFNSGSEEALIYDTMIALGEEDKYMGVYGKQNVIIEVSQGLATVLGGILAEYSFFWCYAASVIVILLSLIPVLFMVEVTVGEKPVKKEKESTSTVVKRHFVTSFNILKSDVRILKIITFFSVVFAAHTVLFYYSQKYYSDLGYSKIEISFIMLGLAVSSCLGAALCDKLYGKIGMKLRLISACAIALALCCFVFKNPAISIVFFSLTGFCNAVLYPIQSDSLNELIPSEQRATLISVSSMCFSIAMILVFPLTGFLAGAFGLEKVFVGMGIALFVFSLICNRK